MCDPYSWRGCAPSVKYIQYKSTGASCFNPFGTKGSDRWHIYTVPCVHMPAVRPIEDLAFLLAVFRLTVARLNR